MQGRRQPHRQKAGPAQGRRKYEPEEEKQHRADRGITQKEYVQEVLEQSLEHSTNREIMQKVSVQEVVQQSPEHKTDRKILQKEPVQEECVCSSRLST